MLFYSSQIYTAWITDQNRIIFERFVSSITYTEQMQSFLQSPDNIFRSKKRYLDPKISFLSNPSLCSSSCSVALRLWCCTGWPGQGSGILNWHLVSFGERHLQASCPFSTPLVFCFIRTPLTLLNFSNKHDLSCLHPKQATRPVKTPWKKCVEKSESCQTVNCTTCLPLELWKQKPRHWQTPRAHFLSKDTSTGDFRDRLKQNHNLVLNNS